MMGGFGRGLGWGYDMMGGGWLGLLLMLLFGLLVLVGIVLLIVWAVRASSAHAPSSGAPPTATEHDEAVLIAKKRLASGEITKEQYDELMRVLGG